MIDLLLRKQPRKMLQLAAAQWRRGRIVSSSSSSSSSSPLLCTSNTQQKQQQQQRQQQRRQNTNGNVSTYRYGGDEDGENNKRIALVLGSSGCLGRAVTRHLVNRLDMQVIGADVVDLPDDTDTSLHHAFIEMPTYNQHPGVADVTAALVSGLNQTLSEEEEIDTIICASGGWQGDPPFPKPDIDDEEFMDSAIVYGQTIDKMMEMNLYPVLAAGYAAHRFMADEGLFVVIGATPALLPTPGMLGYGLSKVGVHHFVQTLGETTGKSSTTKSRRQKARRLRKNTAYLDTLSVVGILPTTIDTPNNRAAMPDADFNKWTNPGDIAKEIGTWIRTPPLRPHSGSLVKVHPETNGAGAVFTLVR